MIRISVVTVVATLLATAAVGQTTKTPPAPAANSPTMAAPATPAPPATSPAHSTASKSAAGRFADEASAKTHCTDDTVVWLNTSSKVYHLAGTPSYGKTKKGAYTCQKDADQGGFHVAKGEVAKASAATAPAMAPKKP